MIKEFDISNLKTLIKQKINKTLNKFDKIIVALIKECFDIKEFISKHENIKMLNMFSILIK